MKQVCFDIFRCKKIWLKLVHQGPGKRFFPRLQRHWCWRQLILRYMMKLIFAYSLLKCWSTFVHTSSFASFGIYLIHVSDGHLGTLDLFMDMSTYQRSLFDWHLRDYDFTIFVRYIYYIDWGQIFVKHK